MAALLRIFFGNKIAGLFTLKTRNGVNRSSIKTINGLAITSLKERNGLT